MEEVFEWSKLKQHPIPRYVKKASNTTMRAMVITTMAGLFPALLLAGVTYGFSITIILISGILLPLFVGYKLRVKPALARAKKCENWTMGLTVNASIAKQELGSSRPRESIDRLMIRLLFGSVILGVTILLVTWSLSLPLLPLLLLVIPIAMFAKALCLSTEIDIIDARVWIRKNGHMTYEDASEQPLEESEEPIQLCERKITIRIIKDGEETEVLMPESEKWVIYDTLRNDLDEGRIEAFRVGDHSWIHGTHSE